MRIAVTGANGLIGGEAVALLADAHELLATGRGPCRLPRGAYRYVEAELGDGGAVERELREFGAEAVLHAGALTDVDECEGDAEAAWRVNVGGSAQVARACRALGARLVAVSTDYVFDGEAGPYGEDDPVRPCGVYGRTKLCGEEAVRLLVPGAAVVRVSAVFGGFPGTRSTFAAQVVEKLSRGEPVRAFSDQRLSPTLASSAAKACVELLVETRHAGLLHASGATVVDRVEFARRVAARFGLRGEIVPVRTAEAGLRAPRPLRGGLRVERAAGLLRHRPLELDEALDRFQAEWAARRR
ncbi:MAG: SDR family oxidoreductase [Deltaproteobacteria bacterium]|nr:SDR family oxidoreductase [Deltaproteobacteria bacterium]